MNNDAGFIQSQRAGSKLVQALAAWLTARAERATTDQKEPVVVERNGVLSVHPAPEPPDFPQTPGLDVVADYGRIGK